MSWYNFKRKHGAIGFISPMEKWEEYYQKMLSKFVFPGQAEAGYAGEQPARNNLTNADDRQAMTKIVPCPSQSSLLNMPSKTQMLKQKIGLNHF